MSDSGKSHHDSKTRRALLKAGAVGTATFVAGCQGSQSSPGGMTPPSGGGSGDGSGSDGTTDTVAEGVYDARFTVLDRAGTPPSERHFNPWNPSTNGCWFPGAIVFDRMAVYSPAANKNFPLIAREWSMPEENVLEVEISDKWKWHNGDQFVAQDWVMEQQIEREIAQITTDKENPTAYESIEAVDDTFIRITLNEPLSETFAVMETIGAGHGFLGRGEFVKHDVKRWKDWHDRLVNGSGSEKEKAVNEITTASWPKISSDEEWIGNGPFKMKAVGDDTIVMKRFEDHPAADQINFQEYALWVPSSTGLTFQPFANGVVDATPKGFPVQKDLRKQLPDQTELFREALSANKLFCFNVGHDVNYDSPVNNRNVRKALAHVFDRSRVQGLLQGVNRLFEWAPCRVPGKVLRKGTIDVSNFTTYGQNDTERAAELLRKEGYERNENDNWLNPDGRPFQISILNAANRPDFQVWIRNLKEFGVLVKQENVGSATFDQRRKNGNYDIIPDGSSANGIFAMWAPSLIIDWVMKTLTHTPMTMEIPMPVGDPDGSSGMKEINIPNHITKWMTTGKDKYHRELMWWWNQTIPEVEVMYQPDAGAINTQHWNFENVPGPIVDGVDDALFVAPKFPDEGTLKYKP